MVSQRKLDPLKSFVVTGGRGRYDRQDRRKIPPGFLSPDEKNLTFYDVDTTICRYPITTMLDLAATLGSASIVRFFPYRITTSGAIRWIVYDDAGRVWDTGALGAPIITFASGWPTDICGIVLNERFYFSQHTLLSGVSGSNNTVYVYDPVLSATARPIAGSRPPGAVTLATSATNGTIEPGMHVVAVSFVTNTGFVTKPGAYASVTQPSGTRKKIDITNIPVGAGGTGTTKRWIWLSKAVQFFDGNIENVEVFFVAEIADNTTTVLTIDAYDTQLVASGDKYINNLDIVPACVAMCEYGGSLVTAGEQANPRVARVSLVGEPEAFNSLDGFITAPSDGGGLRNCKDVNGILYLFKSFRTVGYQRVSELPASIWPHTTISIGQGAEAFGIAQVLDSDKSILAGGIFIINVGGLHFFDGSSFKLVPLSENIRQLWRAAVVGTNITDLRRSNMVVDPIDCVAYMSIGNKFLHCDFSDGLAADSIRWSEWTLPGNPASVCWGVTQDDVAVGRIQVVYANLRGSVDGMKQLRRADPGNAAPSRMHDRIDGVNIYIPWVIETAPIGAFDDTVEDHAARVLVATTIEGGEILVSIKPNANSSPAHSVSILPNLDAAGGPPTSIEEVRQIDFTDKWISLRFEPKVANPGVMDFAGAVIFVAPDSFEHPL